MIHQIANLLGEVPDAETIKSIQSRCDAMSENRWSQLLNRPDVSIQENFGLYADLRRIFPLADESAPDPLSARYVKAHTMATSQFCESLVAFKKKASVPAMKVLLENIDRLWATEAVMPGMPGAGGKSDDGFDDADYKTLRDLEEQLADMSKNTNTEDRSFLRLYDQAACIGRRLPPSLERRKSGEQSVISSETLAEACGIRRQGEYYHVVEGNVSTPDQALFAKGMAQILHAKDVILPHPVHGGLPIGVVRDIARQYITVGDFSRSTANRDSPDLLQLEIKTLVGNRPAICSLVGSLLSQDVANFVGNIPVLDQNGRKLVFCGESKPKFSVRADAAGGIHVQVSVRSTVSQDTQMPDFDSGQLVVVKGGKFTEVELRCGGNRQRLCRVATESQVEHYQQRGCVGIMSSGAIANPDPFLTGVMTSVRGLHDQSLASFHDRSVAVLPDPRSPFVRSLPPIRKSYCCLKRLCLKLFTPKSCCKDSKTRIGAENLSGEFQNLLYCFNELALRNVASTGLADADKRTAALTMTLRQMEAMREEGAWAIRYRGYASVLSSAIAVRFTGLTAQQRACICNGARVMQAQLETLDEADRKSQPVQDLRVLFNAMLDVPNRIVESLLADGLSASLNQEKHRLGWDRALAATSGVPLPVNDDANIDVSRYCTRENYDMLFEALRNELFNFPDGSRVEIDKWIQGWKRWQQEKHGPQDTHSNTTDNNRLLLPKSDDLSLEEKTKAVMEMAADKTGPISAALMAARTALYRIPHEHLLNLRRATSGPYNPFLWTRYVASRNLDLYPSEMEVGLQDVLVAELISQALETHARLDPNTITLAHSNLKELIEHVRSQRKASFPRINSLGSIDTGSIGSDSYPGGQLTESGELTEAFFHYVHDVAEIVRHYSATGTVADIADPNITRWVNAFRTTLQSIDASDVSWLDFSPQEMRAFLADAKTLAIDNKLAPWVSTDAVAKRFSPHIEKLLEAIFDSNTGSPMSETKQANLCQKLFNTVLQMAALLAVCDTISLANPHGKTEDTLKLLQNTFREVINTSILANARDIGGAIHDLAIWLERLAEHLPPSSSISKTRLTDPAKILKALAAAIIRNSADQLPDPRDFPQWAQDEIAEVIGVRDIQGFTRVVDGEADSDAQERFRKCVAFATRNTATRWKRIPELKCNIGEQAEEDWPRCSHCIEGQRIAGVDFNKVVASIETTLGNDADLFLRFSLFAEQSRANSIVKGILPVWTKTGKPVGPFGDHILSLNMDSKKQPVLGTLVKATDLGQTGLILDAPDAGMRCIQCNGECEQSYDITFVEGQMLQLSPLRVKYDPLEVVEIPGDKNSQIGSATPWKDE